MNYVHSEWKRVVLFQLYPYLCHVNIFLSGSYFPLKKRNRLFYHLKLGWMHSYVLFMHDVKKIKGSEDKKVTLTLIVNKALRHRKWTQTYANTSGEQSLKEWSHLTKLSPLFPSRKWLAQQQAEVLKLGNSSPSFGPFIRLNKWETDPFAPKLYSLIQNDICPNFCDRLNFVTCEHSFSLAVVPFVKSRLNTDYCGITLVRKCV